MISEFADKGLNRYISSPRYAANPEEEVCDGIIICGTDAVFIECKGSTFTARSKYSGDPSALGQELEEKLIHNQAGKAKGIEQLARAIERVFSRTEPEMIADLDLSKIQRVFPLLITRDGISNVMMLNSFLNLKFQTVIKRKSVWPRTVTPLCVLSADAFEHIVPYLNKFEFAQIISARFSSDKSLKGSFLIIDNSILDKTAAQPNTLLETAFAEFANGLVSKLFPNEVIQMP
jgi:hypothetical protein